MTGVAWIALSDLDNKCTRRDTEIETQQKTHSGEKTVQATELDHSSTFQCTVWCLRRCCRFCEFRANSYISAMVINEWWRARTEYLTSILLKQLWCICNWLACLKHNTTPCAAGTMTGPWSSWLARDLHDSRFCPMTFRPPPQLLVADLLVSLTLRSCRLHRYHSLHHALSRI